jgi:hypothetical protein
LIITARPPIFEDILAKFPDADKPGVIFAYGSDIYNPSGVTLPRALIEHEIVHCERQRRMGGPAGWWYCYLTDPEFRYQEELPAHAAEYLEQARRISDRNARAHLLTSTAQRLIAPLYNYQPPRSLAQAMRDLKELV